MKIQELAWAGTGAAIGAAAAISGGPPWLAALLAGATTWLALASGRRTRPDAALATSELRQALRRRDEQLAHTAHELRTPLASVVTALEMLRQGYATTPAEIEEFLDQASFAARHLGFLVNDVIDEAALAAGQLRLHCEDRSVRELLASASELLGMQARSRGIDLRFAEAGDEVVHTDERRFLQILVNLVGNALKFTESGEVVRVRVEPRATVVRFVVEDCGAGVPQEARARLFTPFGCAASAPGVAIPGTGLGLHVCKLLVEQLGGRIAYEPAADRGSVFWFELPTAGGAAVVDSTIAETAGQAR